jgi:hypothetical protein
VFTFIETKLFSRLVREYLSDDDYAAVQRQLIANPDEGAVIRGSGGFERSAPLPLDEGSAVDSA